MMGSIIDLTSVANLIHTDARSQKTSETRSNADRATLYSRDPRIFCRAYAEEKQDDRWLRRRSRDWRHCWHQ